MLHVFAPHRRWSRPAGLISAAGFIMIVAGACASSGASDTSPKTLDATAAMVTDQALAGPTGTVVYQVTGKGFFAAPAASPRDATAATWTTPSSEGFVTSPDGRSFAFVLPDDAGLALMVGSSGGSTPVPVARLASATDPILVRGKGEAASVGGVPLVIAWSPDSQRVAFGTLKLPFALTVAERTTAGGWRTSEYRVSGGYVGELRWAPDGSALAISTYALDRKDHTTLLLASGETAVRRLVDGCHIVWSPDSRYLVVRRESLSEPGTWIVSRDGDERIAVTTEPQSFPVDWRG